MLSEKNSKLYLVNKNNKTNLVETISHNYNYAYNSSSELIPIVHKIPDQLINYPPQNKLIIRPISPIFKSVTIFYELVDMFRLLTFAPKS